MSKHAVSLDRLLDLAGTVCDNSASQDECTELDSIMLADREAFRCYLGYCRMHSALRLELRAQRAIQDACRRAGIKLPARDNLDTAATDAVVSPALLSTRSLYYSTLTYIASGWPAAYLIATVILGAGILIGAFTYVSRPADRLPDSIAATKGPMASPSENESVAEITAMVDCEWTDSSLAPVSRCVAVGQKYSLASGLMEITYDTGAKVILQAPAEYDVLAKNGGFLAIGKVTGKVEAEKAKGFSIRTPTACITDFGTEFGLKVDRDGATQTQVFSGSVMVQIDPADKNSENATRVLSKGQSIRVENVDDKHGGDSKPAFVSSREPTDFVRKVITPKTLTLDLADIVAGGNGLSGKRNRGIDPRTGRIVEILPATGKDLYLIGDESYHRVEELPLVDGVFIPNGGKRPVQVDSAGHMFAGFPSTDNRTYACIWAGSVIPGMYAPLSTQLGGVNYARPEHHMLDMLANKGIAFDLDAIRRAHPESKLLRFRAVVGNTERAFTVSEPFGADVWVLVDGQLRFGRKQISRGSGAIPIAVNLGPQDRFLTIASTDGGNGHAWDWILLGDPRLEISGGENSSTSAAPTQIHAQPAHNQPRKQSYNANADMVANETGGAPSLPFGDDNVWSLGYRELLTGADFNELPIHQRSPLGKTATTLFGWAELDKDVPFVTVNPTGASGGVDRGDNSHGPYPLEPDQIVMHPGWSAISKYAVLRWTAPRDGVVDVSTRFTALDITTADVHLMKNGSSLFDRIVNNAAGAKNVNVNARINQVKVSKGDAIEFVVGPNGICGGDAVGVFHSITYSSDSISRDPQGSE